MPVSDERFPDTPGRKRRNAMIQAAYELFTEKGYAAVSVDDIIRISKGSKSSFYKFFGSKDGILKAVVGAHANDLLREIRLELPASRPPREALRSLGMVLVDLALSETAINQHRHAVAHARAFPDIAKLWYESGPKTTFQGVTDFLKEQAAAGHLRIPDPDRAALLFVGMIIFHENMRRLVGYAPANRSGMKEIVAEAVDLFLAAYGT